MNLKNIATQWWKEKQETWFSKARSRKLAHAIKIANELTNADRKTRYVIEVANRFVIRSTEELDNMRKARVIPKKTTIFDIYRKAVYTATFSPEITKNWKITRTNEKTKIERMVQHGA